MKIHVLSDLHLERGGFEDYTPPAGIDIVVLAGDIHVSQHGVLWAMEKFPETPVVYVVGNHEFYRHSNYDKRGLPFSDGIAYLQEITEDTNVHVLENDVYEMDDVVFIGTALWTDYALNGNQPLGMIEARHNMNDYRAIRMWDKSNQRLTPEDALVVFEKAVMFIGDCFYSGAWKDKKKVVVTHHLPSERSVNPKYKTAYPNMNQCYASNLDGLIAVGGAELWIHGHTHDSCDYMIEDTRIVCNPKGYHDYQENNEFDPALVLEV